MPDQGRCGLWGAETNPPEEITLKKAGTARKAVVFAEPRKITSLEGLYFYHAMDLPGESIEGDWDLRGQERAYIGGLDLDGKRVLDVGAASGFMTFAMEKMGAEVVAYDIRDGREWNVVPHHSLHGRMEEQRRQRVHASERLKDSFWYCHKALGSSVKAFYGDIYNLPDGLGPFDVALFGLVLPHLRDPFQALYSGARLTTGKIVVTGMFSNLPNGASVFRPDFDNTHGTHSWWALSMSTLENMLGALGFKVEHVEEFTASIVRGPNTGERHMQAVVAARP